MAKKKVLVCGATGFIGRNVCQALADDVDYEVYGTYSNSLPWENPQVTFIQADLTRAEDVDQAVRGMDIIIQAAATTSGAKDIVSRPYYHVTDNAVMNSLILRSAYEHNVSHVLFFSCTVMYQSSDVPVKESDFDASLEMEDKYFGVGWTKVYIEKMCEFYSQISDTKFTVVRHSNIYGPHDKFDLERSHVFGATMTKVMTAQNGDRIIVWGQGKPQRDLLYVSDLVDFVRLALTDQSSNFELYNVGLGQSISVCDLIDKIVSASGRNLEVEYDSSKPDIATKLCLDISKVNESLGWKPKVSLDEGIGKTIEWYQYNLMQS